MWYAALERMVPLDTNVSSDSPLAEAIGLLQDAIRKEAFDKKAVRADVVKATNILLGTLGLKGVAPDPDVGQ
jgi:hypothetical protein